MKFFGITVFCNCLHRQDVFLHIMPQRTDFFLAFFELLVVFHLKIVLLFVELNFEFFQFIFPESFHIEHDHNQKAEEIIHRANLRGDDIIRDANELLQKASDRADEIESEANDKRLAEEREYDRVRLEVTRFKSDVLNLYRSHVESLSRLPEFQKDEKDDADKKAADEPAEPAAEEPVEDQAAVQQPEAEAPAQEPDTAGKETDSAADAEDDKAVESSEDFWEKDESQLKLDPPADAKPDGPDYDAFQGVKFSE